MKNTDLKRKLRFYGYVNIISCCFLLISAFVVLLNVNNQRETNDSSASVKVYEEYFSTLEKIQSAHSVNIPDVIRDYKSFPFLWKNTPEIQNSGNFDKIDQILQNINTDIQVLRQDSLFSQKIDVIKNKYESIMPYIVSDVFSGETADVKSEGVNGFFISLLLLAGITLVISIISNLTMKHNSDSIITPVYELIENLERLKDSEAITENPISIANDFEFGTIAEHINEILSSLQNNVCSSADDLIEHFKSGKATIQELQINYDKLNDYQRINEKLKQLIFDLRNAGTKFNLEFSNDELVDKFAEIKASFIEYHDFMKKEYNKAVDRDKGITSFICTILADLKDTNKRNNEVLEKDTNLIDIKPILSDIGDEAAKIRETGSTIKAIESDLNNNIKLHSRISDFAEELLMIAINISVTGEPQNNSTQIRKLSEDLKKLSGRMNEIYIQSENNNKALTKKTENINQIIFSSEQMLVEKLKALDTLNMDMKAKARIISDKLSKQNASINEVSQIIDNISSYLESNIYLPSFEKIKERFSSMNSLLNDVPVDGSNLNDLTTEIENKLSAIQNVSANANSLLIEILNEYSFAVKGLNEKINKINSEYDKIEAGLKSKD